MSLTSFPLTLALAASLTLAGCASTTPNLDARFGDAVRQARVAQTLHPEASNNPDPVSGLDGRAARSAMERYHESFKTPPSTFDVIGGTTTQ